MITRLLPLTISHAFKFIKMRKTSEKFAKNPKATNGFVVTIAVTLFVMYAEHEGVNITPEVQEQIAIIFGAVGGLYTTWRASR